MSNVNHAAAYEVTWLVRRLFRSMASAADQYLQDFGISAADRAVMEFLHPEQRLSVPQIAAKYSVSRQHVQVTVNRLIEIDLLHVIDNPRHKRSPLIALSDRGRDLFIKIQRRDDELLQHLFADVPAANVQTTRATLQTLVDNLS